MIRVSKFRRGSNGIWYGRFWVAGRPIDESARTRSESAAEAFRVRREIEPNAGYEPLKHANVGELLLRHLAAMPPKTTAKHKHEVARVVASFVRLCGRYLSTVLHGLKDGGWRRPTSCYSLA